jgi:hypothetical protein
MHRLGIYARLVAQGEVHMQSRLGVIALLVGVALIGPTLATYAKEKGDRVVGTVQLINKDTKSVLVSGEANTKQTQVMYDEKTKVTKDNKAATMDDVQTGVRVICIVKKNDKGEPYAEKIDVRPAH